MKVPFGTITITEKSKELIKKALESGRVSSGKYVREFEEKFAEKMGVKEAVAVSSGTDALVIALSTLYEEAGASRGDLVVLPALSFVATGNAVINAGFEPYFVDIDRKTFNIDLTKVPSWNPDIACYLPVHLMGKPLDIKKLPNKHLVIEDCAEAYGSEINGKHVGSSGIAGCFSTYLAHTISTIEGGAIITNNEDVARIARSLRSHGRACDCPSCLLNTQDKFCPKRFEHGSDIRFIFERIGYSSKMNELEAAVGIGNLEIYDEIIERRYKNLLFMIDNFPMKYLWSFDEKINETIGPHAFPIIVEEDAPFTRDQLALYLEQKGIETRTMFASMPTQCKGFEYLGHKLGDFPNAEYIGTHGLHIGIHQDLNLDHMLYVLETITDFLNSL